MANGQTRRRSKLKSTRHWHRYLGLVAVFFALILATTGIMLNHTEALNLDSRFVRSKLLLRWYGMGPPAPPVSFLTENIWFSQVGRQVFMNASRLHDTDSNLVGAVRLSDILVLAFQSQLTLVTEDGEIIEHLKREAEIPEDIQRIGVDTGSRLVVRTPTGDFWTDEDMLDWYSFNSDHVLWSDSAVLPISIEEKLMAEYQGEGLPWEWVILDLHSGRILGPWGVYLFDGIAIIIILLAFTGAYIFFFPAGLRKRKTPKV